MKLKKAIGNLIIVIPFVAWFVFLYYLPQKGLSTTQELFALFVSVLLLLLVYGFLRIFVVAYFPD